MMIQRRPIKFCVAFLVGMITMFTLTKLQSSWTPSTILYVKSSWTPSTILDEIKTTDTFRKEFDCEVPPLVDLEDFFNFTRRGKYPCNNMREFGGKGRYRDGAKWVCLDYPVKPGNCTVLSFGISKDWSFDDAMDKHGCQVYAFDPSIGLNDFNRSARIHFYNLGLSDFQGEFVTDKGEKWKMDRYENIIKKLGLTGVDIDYLKMDIEGSEMQFMADVFKNSLELMKKVKQIGMEIHPHFPSSKSNQRPLKDSSFGKLWSQMHYLECYGFRMINLEQNRVPRTHYKWNGRIESSCYEMLWVRVDK